MQRLLRGSPGLLSYEYFCAFVLLLLASIFVDSTQCHVDNVLIGEIWYLKPAQA